MPTPACLYLLDEPHVRVGEVRHDLTPSRPVQLLIYLACRGEWVGREALAALFWPDSPEEEARHNLRVVLHRARALPWAGGLEVERERVRLVMDTDTTHFRQALGQAGWEQAVRLHRRPFLQGFPLQDAPALDDWAAIERESLREAWQQAARHHAEALQQAEQHTDACKLLAEILRQNLLSEDIVQDYLRAAYLAGQREAALKLYERFVQELRQELGLEPMRATQELAQALRRSEPLQAAPQKPPPRIPLEVLRPPRLVGREAEQARLRGSSALLVHGEPGVGKSRLLQEVFPQAPLMRAREGLENVPFYPVLDYLKANLANLPDLGPYREDLARLLPEVYPGFTPPPAEPGSAKARLLEALSRALAPAGRLLFDDLQWADEGTLELLLYLHSRGQPWAGAYRSHEVGPALAKAIEALRGSGAEELALEPLAAPSVQALLADLIGVEEGPPVFAGWLHGQTGGNPFFALETLKALFENGVLRAEQGQWHTDLDEVTRDYSELQIPPKVAEVIRRRVGRLSEPALRVVQAASVVGEGFGPRLLAGVTGLSEWAVLEGLEETEQAGIVAGERFVHDVLKQGIYQGLAPTRCKALHARVAERLEGQAKPQVVAEHWFRAGEVDRAVQLWQTAAQHLDNLGLHQEAIFSLERALECTHNPAHQNKIKVQIAEQYHELAEYTKATEIIEQTLPVVLDSSVQAKLRALQVHILSDLGKYHDCARIIQEHLHDVDSIEDPQIRREVRWAISTAYGGLGKFAEALEIIQNDLSQLEDAQPSVTLADYLSSMGSTLDHLGRHQEALICHQRAYQMAKQLNARNMQVITVQNLLFCLATLERSEEGIGPAEEALSLGHFARSDVLRNNLAATLQKLGRYEESIQHFQYLADHAREPMWRAVAQARLAEARAKLGHLEAVSPALDAALQHLDETDYPFARALVASRVLLFGSSSQVERIRPILDQLDPQTLSPMVRSQLEQAQADYLARVRSSKT